MDYKNILVSVIVPIFNVKNFIYKVVESISTQTYENIEIILVDDGSSDGSSELLDKIAKEYKNIKILHKKNGGVSSARNEGINIAKGDYIVFIDADDWVDNNHIEYLLSLALKYNVPIVYGTQHYLNSNTYNEDNDDRIVTSDDIVQWIYECKIYMAVWNRIYSRKFLNDNNIRFNENIWYSEGMHFNMQCLKCVKKVAIGSKRTYHYMDNPNSVMRKCFKLENELNALGSLEDQKEFINLDNKKVKNAYIFHTMIVYDNIRNGIIKDNLQKKYPNELKQSIKYIKKNCFVPFKIDLKFKTKIRWFLVSIFPITISKYLLRKHIKNN